MRRLALLPVMIASLCAAAPAADDPAAFAPKHTVFYVSARDVRDLVEPALQTIATVDEEPAERMRRFLDRIRPMLAGRGSLAVVKTNGREPHPLGLIEIDPDKGDLDKLVAETLNVHVKKDGRLRAITFDGETELAWTVRGTTAYLSDSPQHLKQMLAPGDGAPANLSMNDDYRALGKYVDWDADVVTFVDLEGLLWRNLRRHFDFDAAGPRPFELADWALRGSKLTDLRALGCSLSEKEHTTSARLAVLTPQKREGLAALFDVRDRAPAHLDRLPANCQIVSAQSACPLADVIATTMAGLDPDMAREFKTELAEFSKELGVDLESDLLNAFQSMTTGVGFTMKMKPRIYGVSAVRDPAAMQKCLAALARYNKTPLGTVEHEGHAFRSVPLGTRILYTFSGDDVLFSLSPGSMAEMLDVKPENSLATNKVFKRLRDKLPDRAMMYWAVDPFWAAGLAGMALAAGRNGEPPEGVKHLFQSFQKAGPGLSLGLALRNEPDAYVVHLECLSGDLWKLTPLAAELAAPDVRREGHDRNAINAKGRLHSIARATKIWSVQHGDDGKKYPPSLKALLDDNVIADPEAFLRPGSGAKLVEGEFVSDFASTLDRCPYQLTAEMVGDGKVLLAWEKRPYRGVRNVVYFDGSVIPLGPDLFRDQLKALEKWIEENKPEKKPDKEH